MEKFKIAIVFSGNPFQPKGLFNAVINRARYLKLRSDYDVSVFCLCSYENALVRRLHNSSAEKLARASVMNIGDVEVNICWYPFSLIDYLLNIKLKIKTIFFQNTIKNLAKQLECFNLVSAHSYDGGLVAYEANKKFGIPYTMTWHGSDIHTMPWTNKSIMKDTKKLSSSANANFYVSNALKILSDKIVKTENKFLSYNGADECFVRFPKDKINEIKEGFGVDSNKKIISFIGGLIGIKNVLLIPEILDGVKRKYGENIVLWIIGDGKLKSMIKEKLESKSNIKYKFFGDVSTEEVISLMNCTDVLILPSKNEGLPLVIVEAYKCGTKVVASNVGGCIEVIGKENVIELDDNFIENFSIRVSELLKSEEIPELKEDFNWEKTVDMEINVFEEILSKS